jgi:hypothetical protein
VPAERSTVSAVPPGATTLRVLHVHGRAEAADAQSLAEHERGLGWDVRCCAVGSLGSLAGQVRRPGTQVVVLHGRRAGVAGRLLLRGSRATVLRPRPGTWCSGHGPLAAAFRTWERWAAGWTSAVLLSDPAEAATGVAAHVWVPPFVVGDSLELAAAVLTRAQAFGRPSARLAAAAAAGGS